MTDGRHRTHRADGNQGEIVRALLQIGAKVEILSQVGAGCPDLLVGYHRRNYLMEVKNERGDLSARQVIWHKDWPGQVAVVRSGMEAIAVLNEATRRG